MRSLSRTLSLLLAVAAVPIAARADEPPPPVAAPNDPPRGMAPASAPPVVVVVPPPAAPVAPTGDGTPLAGYSNGGFYLRDPNGWFVLFPKGRLQVDWYNFLNRGDAPADGPNQPDDKRPHDTLFVRRIRPEMQGTFFKHFDFHLSGEFASTPATGAYGTLADAYVVVDYFSFLKLEVGQFDAPFTMENRTSDKYFDFMERSIVVRSFGVPQNKEDGGMLFGFLPRKLGYYSVGLFNGAGQNFKSQSNSPLVLGRAFIAPLGPLAGDRKWMEDIWVGGSFWFQRAYNTGGSIAPSATAATPNDLSGMSTQGGFGFFSTSYGNGKDSAGNSVRTHLAPAGDTVKWALEANVPVKRVGARFELVHQSIDLGAYNDTAVRNFNGQGQLTGTGYYVELYGWLLGDTSFLETPGLENMPHWKPFAVAKEPKWGLMLAAKYEHVGFNLGTPTSMDAMGATVKDAASGNYSVDAFELGVNAWASKHVRITGNYVLNYIDGDSKQVKGNPYYQRAEHELLFRVGINL